MNNVIYIYTILLLFCNSLICQANPLDLNFGNNGSLEVSFPTNVYGRINIVLAKEYSENRILCIVRNDSLNYHLIQVDFDGNICNDFPNLFSQFSLNQEFQITSFSKDENGCVYILGNKSGIGFILKLDNNLTIDVQFGTNGFFYSPLYSTYDFKLSNDFSIILCGELNSKTALCKITSNGTIDTLFGNMGISTIDVLSGRDWAYGIVIQPDGKLVTVGSATAFERSIYAISVVRFFENGAVDNSFGTSGIILQNYGLNKSSYGSKIETDNVSGNIVIAGLTSGTWNGSDDIVIGTISNNGQVLFNTYDYTINTLPMHAQDYPTVLKLQFNGKILVGLNSIGLNSEQSNILARFMQTGTPDNSFNSTGYWQTTYKNPWEQILDIVDRGQIGIYYLSSFSGKLLIRRFIQNDSNALPVKISDFKCNIVNNHIEIKWETTCEVNNYGFEISGYKNNDWIKYGFVFGFGSTTENKSYSFILNEVSIEKVKLVQVDLTGQSEVLAISDIRDSENILPKISTKCFPNPFNNSTNIIIVSGIETKADIVLYNSIGQIMAENKFNLNANGESIIKYDFSNYSTGTYFFKIKAFNKTQLIKTIYLK